MLANLKKWAIYAAIAITIIGLSFFGGIMYKTYTASPIIVGNGTIVERTNYVYTEIPVDSGSPCADYVRRLNMCNRNIERYLNAIPEVYETTTDKIYFRLSDQKYSLSYKASDRPRWTLAPCVYVRSDFRSGINCYIGGGVSIDYGIIGGFVMADNAVSVSIGATFRGITW
jgi:hypothetical protein